MNIFYLHDDPKTCAEMHLDKHVVKMILEYAQLLSTAHRVLDGEVYEEKTKAGRSIKRYALPDDKLEKLLFKASHIKHPSAIWCRANVQNYMWLAELLECLCVEYTHRYGKIHSVQASGLMQELKNNFPYYLPIGPFTEPPPAMPEDCKIPGNSIASYHKYYVEKKRPFAKWTNRPMPDWFADALNSFNEACYILNDIKRARVISMSTLLMRS
jgi:hypothetical protein